MIKVSVFYPKAASTKFDMAYYLNKHMPMVQKLLGSSLKGMAVEQGISGGQAGSAPTYVAMGHLLFNSVEEFEKSWAPHAKAIVGDVPNYTNSEPLIQISEVKL
jgi:uncharacterized protein (TIGR02118 family)